MTVKFLCKKGRRSYNEPAYGVLAGQVGEWGGGGKITREQDGKSSREQGKLI